MAKVDNITNFIRIVQLHFMLCMIILKPITGPRQCRKVHIVITNVYTVKVRVLANIKRAQKVLIASKSKEFRVLANIKRLKLVTTTEEIIEFRTVRNVYLFKLNVSIYSTGRMRNIKFSDLWVLT